MATEEIKQGKVIGNVGTLDLRAATEEAVAAIRRIGNVGMVIHSPETAHLIPRLNMGNVGSTLEAPADAKMLSGQVSLSFKDVSQPLYLIASGQIIIEPEVRVEDVERGLGMLVCSGQIFCPEHLMGAVQSKMREASGQLLSYSPAMRLHLGKLILNKHILNAMDDDAELLIAGHLELPEVVDNDLLARKVARLQVVGKITCREENLPALYARLDQKAGSPKVSFVPAGFEPVEGALALNDAALLSLPGPRLYCTGRVLVEPETNAEALDKALGALQVTQVLIGPAALKSVLVKKCNMLKTKAIFYEGELWLVEEETELPPSRFEYLEGKATLVVRDTLKIDPKIEPKVLAERLHKVHNLDTILCTPEQMGALQARLGLNEGEFEDSTKGEEEEGEEEGMGNVGHLRL
jgi:hypothetical protein